MRRIMLALLAVLAAFALTVGLAGTATSSAMSQIEVRGTCGVNIGGTNFWYTMTTTYDENFAQGTVAWLNTLVQPSRGGDNSMNFDAVINVHRVPYHRRTLVNRHFVGFDQEYDVPPAQYGEELIVDVYAWPGSSNNHPYGAAHCRHTIYG